MIIRGKVVMMFLRDITWIQRFSDFANDSSTNEFYVTFIFGPNREGFLGGKLEGIIKKRYTGCLTEKRFKGNPKAPNTSLCGLSPVETQRCFWKYRHLHPLRTVDFYK